MRTFGHDGLALLTAIGLLAPAKAQLSCYSPGTVTYYGFFGSDYADTGWRDGWKSMTQGANITFVRDTTAQRIVDGLLAAELRGQKAVVSLDTYIFNWATARPYPDWRTRMDVLFGGGVDPANGQYTAGIFYAEPHVHLYATTVAAFYLQDEPYLNGYLHGVSAQTILDNANTVVARLKSGYGPALANTPVAQIYSYYELDPDNTFLSGYIPTLWINLLRQHAILIPTGVNWVGFDCYSGWISCAGLPINEGVTTDTAGPGSGVPAHDSWYKRLKLLTNSDRQYFYPNGPLRSLLVPPSSIDSGRDEAAISTWSQYYAYTAQNDRAVVGIFNWLWGNYLEPPYNTLGLGSLSSHTQQAFESMAMCALNTSWNHLMNGGFELGEDGWAYVGSPFSVHGVLNNGTAQSGLHYIGQWTVGKGWSYTYQIITGLPFGTYTLSAYVRKGSNISYVTVGGKNCNGAGTQGPGNISGSVGLNWTPISVPVVVDNSGVCEIYIYSETNGSTDYTDIDNVRFQ